ncbi:MAG: hypothetical protein ACR2PI_10455 [Hyphomicrobiaceae bacterium]
MPRGSAKLRLLIVLSAIAALTWQAAAKEPPVPPGLSPVGGVAVALLGPGVDYRRAELRRRFARDGEGVLIAWDFTDDDPAPFAEAGPGTAAAMTLAALAPAAQLVIVKQRKGDPQAFGHMMTFVARTPTRIVVWLEADPKRPDWPILAEATKRFGDRLFVLPAGDGGKDLDRSAAYQGLRGAGNVVIVASDAAAANRGVATVDVMVSGGAGGLGLASGDAALIIAAVAARALAIEPARSMAALKQAIVKHGRLTVDAANAAFGGKR